MMHIRRWIFVAIMVLAAGYFFYEARGIIFPPELQIFKPENGATLNYTEIHIAGRTDPNLNVWVAGKTFRSNEKGIFEGNLTLDPGFNQIGISARDRFGNETRKILKLFVK